MIYDVRMIHNESGAVAYLTLRAPNAFEARALSYRELARKGYAEPHAGAWRIFALAEWPDSSGPIGDHHAD